MSFGSDLKTLVLFSCYVSVIKHVLLIMKPKSSYLNAHPLSLVRLPVEKLITTLAEGRHKLLLMTAMLFAT